MMENLKLKEIIEDKIKELPLVQYEWISPRELSFKQEVREICKKECPMYGKSWSCPPAVGTVEECRKRCLEYSGVFLFTTIAEVSDISNMEETLRTRASHENYTREIGRYFQEAGAEIRMLSSESCAICESCGYCQGEACRSPEYMLPCIESYGILVTEIAEAYGIDFFMDMTTVQWFGMIFYR
jgi:predicted metal-binding protein